MTIVRITAGHRADQYGELSELIAPSGKVYVRLPERSACRHEESAKAALKRNDFGAVSLQSWDDLEAME